MVSDAGVVWLLSINDKWPQGGHQKEALYVDKQQALLDLRSEMFRLGFTDLDILERGVLGCADAARERVNVGLGAWSYQLRMVRFAQDKRDE